MSDRDALHRDMLDKIAEIPLLRHKVSMLEGLRDEFRAHLIGITRHRVGHAPNAVYSDVLHDKERIDDLLKRVNKPY